MTENASLTLVGYDRALRAYGLAYLSTTGPRLLNLLLYWYRKKSARHHILSSVSSWGFVIGSVIRRFPSEVPVISKRIL